MTLVYEFPFILAIIISLLLAQYARHRRQSPGAAPFSWMMIGLSIWSFFSWVGLDSPILSYKLLWVQLSYIGILIIPISVMILSIEYPRQTRSINRRWVGILLVEPLLLLVILWTGPLQHLFWTTIQVRQTNLYSILTFTYGPAYWLHLLYSNLLLVIATVILCSSAHKIAGLKYRKIAIIMLGVLFPWINNLAYPFGYSLVQGFDLTPVFFAITSPLIAWGLFHFRLVDIIPVAYDLVIGSMADGVIIFDEDRRVIAFNPAAQRLTGLREKEVIGRYAKEAIPDWLEIQSTIPKEAEIHQEILHAQDGEMHYLDLTLSPLRKLGRSINGSLLVIRDITRHRLSEQAHIRRNAEFSALHATLLDITAAHHLPDLLQTITERAAHLLEASGSSLFLADRDRREVKCVVSFNNKLDRVGDVFSYQQRVPGIVAETGLPLGYRQGRTWLGPPDFDTYSRPTNSLLAVPLIWQGHPTGVIIVVDETGKRSFQDTDVELLTMLANQASIAVENARLLQSEREQRQQAVTLREITSVLSASLDQHQVLDLILEQLARVIPFDSASLMLISGDYLDIVAARGLPTDLSFNPHFEINRFYHLQEMIETRHWMMIPKTQADPRWLNFPQSKDILCWLGIPLIYQNSVIGLLNLDKQEENYYNESHAEIAMAYANQAALAIENARLFEAAKHRAEEAETLRQATSVVAGTLDQENSIDRILVELEKVVPYDSASVQLLQDGYLEIVGGRGWPEPEKIVGLRFPIPGNNPNTIVIEQRQPYVLDQVSDHFMTFRNLPHDQIKSWLGVPLMVHDQVIGMLAVDSSQPNRYTPDHARLAVVLADQVAIAIENARLFTNERRRAEELDALWATIGDISAELELPKLLQSILERSVALLKASGGELGLYDRNTNLLKIVSCYQMGIDTAGITLNTGEGAMGKVVETGQAVRVADYFHWKGRSEQYPQGPWHSILAVPMQIGGRLVGVIGVVDLNKDRIFSFSEERLLALFSQQAAIAVENAQLYQSARVASERWAVLHHASQEVVAASLDPEGIYTAIHQAAAKLMPSEAFAITLNDEANQLINAVYIVDHMGRAPIVSFPANRGLSGHVIQTGKSLYIEDMLDKLDKIDSIRIGDKEEVRSILAVPMWLGGKVVGMLSTQSYLPSAYTPEDQYLLEMLASYAAVALDNARLFQEVQKLAITDPLTGIFNRRQLFDLGQREYHRSLRFNRPLSAIMLDIDRFKDVNDIYGHHTGDQVLRMVAKTIQGLIREIDVLGRYGGEEFVVLLPETNCNSAARVAERLRKKINSTTYHADQGPVQVTVSLGVAERTEDILDFAGLVVRADAAMYDAKHAGRNRVGIR